MVNFSTCPVTLVCLVWGMRIEEVRTKLRNAGVKFHFRTAILVLSLHL
jgi:hypothetical protein